MGLKKNNQNLNNNQTLTGPPLPSSSSPHTPISAPHELYPLPTYNPQTPCSVCGLKSSGAMLSCKTCSLTNLHKSCADLHQACTKLPRSFIHPSHGSCHLSFTIIPASASFSCDGCRKPGDKRSSPCQRCDYDLHVSCVVKPLKVRQQAHASCELDLTFKGPHMNSMGFRCNVCSKSDSDMWRYRCSSCDFDVHLDCVTGAPLFGPF